METLFNKVNSSKFCISIFDGTHDSPKYHNIGFPLVTSKCIIDGNVDSSIASCICKEDFDAINKRSKVQQYDILVSMIGINAGIVGLIKDEPKYAIKNVGVFRCKGEVDAKYLFYYLQSHKGIYTLRSAMEGSAQPYIALEKLRNLIFDIPTSKYIEQHIVNTISSHLLKSL